MTSDMAQPDVKRLARAFHALSNPNRLQLFLNLLEESRLNHWGKLAFRPLYWNALLPGRPLPVSTRMSMRGKRPLAPLQTAA